MANDTQTTTTKTDGTAGSTSTVDAVTAKAETLFGQARDAIEEALDTTVQAVKDHPLAAAGIAAGAAAAVAGAAYGASKLAEKGSSGSGGGTASKKN